MPQLATALPKPSLQTGRKTGFNILRFMKTVLSHEAVSTDRAALKVLPSVRCDVLSMVEDAIVTQVIAPGRKGQVKYQGSWWTARCHDNITLLVGDIVQVRSRQSLTLYIEPMPTVSRALTLCKS